MIATLQRMLRPLRNQIANMVARAVVQLVNDSGKLQMLQLGVLDGETREAIERFQDYGLTSVPLEGAEAVVLFVNGRRDHGLVVAVDDRRHRKTGLAPGEVALYNHAGAGVHLAADGTTTVGGDGASQPGTLATALRTELDALWTALQGHVHPGVTAGSASTGAPTVTKAAQTIASATVKVRT